MTRRILPLFLLLVSFLARPLAAQETGDELNLLTPPAQDTGLDLLPVFAAAHAGQPLRVVALGGSITQGGKGWVESFLQTQFPKSAVRLFNAGFSATGSDLGVFRVERDVIAFQPHLVMIEYAVNDGGSEDENVIRTAESLVVRLKSLKHPPAVVFIQTAQDYQSNRARHEAVAAHYKLLNVDLQKAVNRRLEAGEADWKTLFSDNCHPNAKGHEFYTEVISGALLPLIERARTDPGAAAEPLPAPLSQKPLFLDGRLAPLVEQDGWHATFKPDGWYRRCFQYSLECKEPGKVLEIPFRGTTAGLWYMLSKTQGGEMVVGVDGELPRRVPCNSRDGYAYKVFATDLAPGEHILRVALSDNSQPGGVLQLCYLLVAGDTGGRLAPQGGFVGEKLTKFGFTDVPARAWKWIGPFGEAGRPNAGPTTDLNFVFGPETDGFKADKSYPAPGGGTLMWKAVDADGAKVPLDTLTGAIDHGVSYLYAEVNMERGGERLMTLQVDYFAKVWVNGELVKLVDGPHGGANERMYIPVTLKPGPNRFFLKIHSGSAGNHASVGFVRD